MGPGRQHGPHFGTYYEYLYHRTPELVSGYLYLADNHAH